MDEKEGAIGDDGTQDELVDNVVEEKVYVPWLFVEKCSANTYRPNHDRKNFSSS